MKSETGLIGARFAKELINMHRNYETRISKLEHTIEELLDTVRLQKAIERKEESLPSEITKRIVGGESPVRAWREHRGMSQSALAKKAGIKQSMVSAIESGGKKGSIETLKALASALKVDLEDIA